VSACARMFVLVYFSEPISSVQRVLRYSSSNMCAHPPHTIRSTHNSSSVSCPCYWRKSKTAHWPAAHPQTSGALSRSSCCRACPTPRPCGTPTSPSSRATYPNAARSTGTLPSRQYAQRRRQTTPVFSPIPSTARGKMWAALSGTFCIEN
jgi:hypothetical protein